MDERALSLLKDLNLSDRMLNINSSNTPSSNNIDYTVVNNLYRCKKIESNKILINSLY